MLPTAIPQSDSTPKPARRQRVYLDPKFTPERINAVWAKHEDPDYYHRLNTRLRAVDCEESAHVITPLRFADLDRIEGGRADAGQ